MVGEHGTDPVRPQPRATHVRLLDGGGDGLRRLRDLGPCRDGGRHAADAAYGAFSYGLICWGWQIISYFTGYVSGPRRTACPPNLRGLSRFVEAVRTSLYHEIAALVGAVALRR